MLRAITTRHVSPNPLFYFRHLSLSIRYLYRFWTPVRPTAHPHRITIAIIDRCAINLTHGSTWQLMSQALVRGGLGGVSCYRYSVPELFWSRLIRMNAPPEYHSYQYHICQIFFPPGTTPDHPSDRLCKLSNYTTSIVVFCPRPPLGAVWLYYDVVWLNGSIFVSTLTASIFREKCLQKLESREFGQNEASDRTF